MKKAAKISALHNFTFVQEDYLGLSLHDFHAVKREGETQHLSFHDENIYKEHLEVLEEISNFDHFLTANFGANALHKIFGLNESPFATAQILMGFNEEVLEGGDYEYYSGFMKDPLTGEKTFSFVVVHPAFDSFKIALKVHHDRMCMSLNKVRKSADCKDKKVFLKVLSKMLFFMFKETALFDRIELVAAREGDKYIGYSYWPEVGFETSEIIEVEGLPKLFQHFTPEDFKRWREVGHKLKMYCDKALYDNYTVAILDGLC